MATVYKQQQQQQQRPYMQRPAGHHIGHPHVRTTQGTHQHHQLPQIWCTFCLKDKSRKDNFAYTHRLRDRDGRLTCPFLAEHMCGKCFHFGHTEAYCTYAEDQLAATMDRLSEAFKTDKEFDPAVAIWRQKMREMEEEEERLRVHCNQEYKLWRVKECGFCKHGNYQDEYYKTHCTERCPRLSCTKCTYCKRTGHTIRHCTTRQMNEILRTIDPRTSQFYMDFDAEEEREAKRARTDQEAQMIS